MATTGTSEEATTNSASVGVVDPPASERAPRHDDNDDGERKKLRARGRWKLLRQVLLAQKTTSEQKKTGDVDAEDSVAGSSSPAVSIHSFAGYNLLKSEPVDENLYDPDSLVRRLGWAVPTENEESWKGEDRNALTEPVLLLDQLRISLLAALAVDHRLRRLRCTVRESSLGQLLSRHRCQPPQEEPAGPEGGENSDNRSVLLLRELSNQLRVACDDFLLQCDCEFVGTSIGTDLDTTAGIEEPSDGRMLDLVVLFQPKTSVTSSYAVRRYDLPLPPANEFGRVSDMDENKSNVLLVRERVAFKPTLKELVSHQDVQRGGVDNTGNVCVWDSERTLAYILSRHEGVEELDDSAGPVVITELGSGQAGLAALSLCLCLRRIGMRKMAVCLTDGHVDCVLNNRINVRLMKAAEILPDEQDCIVHCRQLLWSASSDDGNAEGGNCDECGTDPILPPPPADYTLISDCTHFQNFHAELFWTLIRCTRTGSGQIWMCQPDRGNSLQRFLALVETVNDGDVGGGGPLVQVQERRYERLEKIHRELMVYRRGAADDGGEDVESSIPDRCRHYNPNIHRPRIFVLRKLRNENDEDRRRALGHVRDRDRST